MRILSFLLFLLTLPHFSFAQTDETFDLQWKVSAGDTLSYLTVMDELDSSKFSMDFNLNRFLGDTSISRGTMQETLKNLQEVYSQWQYVSTLTQKSPELVEVLMNAEKKPSPEEEEGESDDEEPSEKEKAMKEQVQKMMEKNLALRGTLYNNGEIHSFWMKSKQKNLLSLFFELPEKPVKIGESWTLNIDFIAFDQHFLYDSAYKRNEAKLVAIKKQGEETIAVIEYDAVEYVKGTFRVPDFFQSEGAVKEVPTMMAFTYRGIAEFSLEKGRWVSYEAIAKMDSYGMIDANSQKKFALLPLEKSPEADHTRKKKKKRKKKK